VIEEIGVTEDKEEVVTVQDVMYVVDLGILQETVIKQVEVKNVIAVIKKGT
jgi:hypothetical protein